jgi:glycosyltransferase involved in cell wall biosynthesis
MITVIIPVYNKQTTIQQTLTSVINQSFKDFEIVIVDDGSTDNSISIVNNNFNDNRIKIISQKNQGVSIARNHGVFHSRYELIAFLDADDLWNEKYLEFMVKAYKMFPDAGMYCCAGYVKNADGSLLERVDSKIINPISRIDFFQNPHIYLHTSSTVVKKNVFNIVGGFPEKMIRNQDFALFFSVALISDVVYCNHLLSTYVGGVANQATSSFSDKTLESIIWRYNHVHRNWIKFKKKPYLYLVFTKYEIRHRIKNFIVNNQFAHLYTFLNDLDSELMNEFSFSERFLYKKTFLKRISILYINLTKVRWRLRGFQRVNKYLN